MGCLQPSFYKKKKKKKIISYKLRMRKWPWITGICATVSVEFVSHLLVKEKKKEKKNVAPVSHGKISERQRNFPCSEAEGNNGLLDQRS